MNSKSLLLLIALFCTTQLLSAQDCKGFFPFEPNTKIEMTQYNKKGKKTSVTQTTIKNITEVDGQTKAEMSSLVLDKKGKELHTGDYDITCTEEGYEIDVTSMLNPALLKSTYNMEVEMTGDALLYPAELEVGQELPDGSSKIAVSTSGMTMMTTNFNITNRKVVLQESVTTPAGTFDCYKLEYEFDMKMAFVSETYKVVQWIGDGVGVVKDEMYNRRGKLESSSELTKLEKP